MRLESGDCDSISTLFGMRDKVEIEVCSIKGEDEGDVEDDVGDDVVIDVNIKVVEVDIEVND